MLGAGMAANANLAIRSRKQMMDDIENEAVNGKK